MGTPNCRRRLALESVQRPGPPLLCASGWWQNSRSACHAHPVSPSLTAGVSLAIADRGLLTGTVGMAGASAAMRSMAIFVAFVSMSPPWLVDLPLVAHLFLDLSFSWIFLLWRSPGADVLWQTLWPLSVWPSSESCWLLAGVLGPASSLTRALPAPQRASCRWSRPACRPRRWEIRYGGPQHAGSGELHSHES